MPKIKIEFVAQPDIVRVDRYGEITAKLIVSRKYRDAAWLLGGLCDGETCVSVTIEPIEGKIIGTGKRKPAEKVEVD